MRINISLQQEGMIAIRMELIGTRACMYAEIKIVVENSKDMMIQ